MTYTFNKELGKIMTADKQRKSGEKKTYAPSIRINGNLLDSLKKFAVEDGVKLTKLNKKKQKVEDTWALKQAVELYTKAAVNEFIEARQGKR